MYDSLMGLPNYFATAYFWTSTVICVVVAAIAAWRMD